MRRRLASMLLLAAAGVSPLAGAAVETLELSTPRAFGYVLGDTIEHRVSLVLDPGFELDSASIPRPGRVVGAGTPPLRLRILGP